MTDGIIRVQNSHEIKGRANSVRIAVVDGKTYFSIRDVVYTCGIRHPDKWIARERKVNSNFNPVKIVYPFRTTSGMRGIAMCFGDKDTCEAVVSKMAVDEKERKWLLEEVFAYGNDGEQKNQEPITQKEVSVDKDYGYDDIETRIDSIIMELIQIKREVYASRVAILNK